MPPKSALFISKEWCNQIFDGNKTWELRSFPMPEHRKRKPTAIAMSKCNRLVGEVTFDKCLRVGRRRDDTGKWEPVTQSEKYKKNLFLAPRNEVKCGFNKTNVPRVISKYREIYAWKMSNMAFDLNNLRSDVKTMAEKLDARNQQKRGDKTETDGTPRFHGIKIKSYCCRSSLVSMNYF